jgi:hydrogenase maturation protease
VSEAGEPAGGTVVIGVGNELFRDEGVGVVVAREFAAAGAPEGVRVVEGAVGGLNLLFDMEGAARVVIIDAVDMGQPPGTVRVFTPEEVEMEGLPVVASLHQVGLSDVLELGPLVGVRPEVHIVGIQPAEVVPGFELTKTVAAVVSQAVSEVRRLCLEPLSSPTE